MQSLPITNVTPRVQYIAVNAQTVFNVPFVFFAQGDLTVYQTPVGTTPNDATNVLILTTNYTVQLNPVTFVGTITLNVGANAGDIITIVRSMSYQRLNFYMPGFGNFTPDAVNTDFETDTLLIQQNNMYNTVITPRYNLSANPLSPTDLYLPVLPANCIWAKDPTNSFIQAVTLPGGSTVLPTNANGIAYFTNAAGQLASTAAVNSAVLVTTNAGVPQLSATMTNGQVIIGSTGATPTAATLTAGAGITVTNGAGAITISAVAAGYTWNNVVAAAQALVAENAYVTNRAAGVTYTLPAAGVLGDSIKIDGGTAGGITTIAQNAGQQIVINGLATTVGVAGTLTATGAGDCLVMSCITPGANTVWRVDSSMGNWIPA